MDRYLLTKKLTGRESPKGQYHRATDETDSIEEGGTAIKANVKGA